MKHADWMDLAIKEAQLAKALKEAPIGCVIVKDGVIIGKGHNTRETNHTALGHAELSAIREACRALHSWRLVSSTLYVTLEPCPMCMGAIFNARIPRVVFGASDAKAGCCGSIADFNALPLNHKVELIGGVREAACEKLLSDFFAELRKNEIR